MIRRLLAWLYRSMWRYSFCCEIQRLEPGLAWRDAWDISDCYRGAALEDPPEAVARDEFRLRAETFSEIFAAPVIDALKPQEPSGRRWTEYLINPPSGG